ncbi:MULTISPECIES: class I SAM-dependent methyltransferase [unclassified Bradyrhizobium]|uniref:class I SAM-dependent methyltransferase n=1 Tax=unclassified Bradyrhizobium TaxID=2631580 RepID=UPI001CD2C54E|nr:MULTISPECIES: class I SAM-dependent methyltransferase [unclassified Bradyrhizobium]MCA1379101.1 class I SAM-dependent methyltransferase [Bradyrhizobium sp. IC4060]MCA1489135.1 class I SAM-dependent methyltransferase [Bradyrhizobium sp. IC4061]
MNEEISTPRQTTQEKVAEDFDGWADSYVETINQAIAFTGRGHAFYVDIKCEHILRLAQRHFTDIASLRVLDLGCGIGAYHPGLKARFQELHGVEVSAQSVKLAARRHSFVRYSTYDGSRLPYGNGTFSMVFTMGVMHHVPPLQWSSFVAEAHRVTAPGGLMLVFENNPYNPLMQYFVRTCEIDKDAVLLRPGKLRRIFAAAGFTDVYTRTIISVPPAGRFLTKVDWLLGTLPFGAQYYLSATKKPL